MFAISADDRIISLINVCNEEIVLKFENMLFKGGKLNRFFR